MKDEGERGRDPTTYFPVRFSILAIPACNLCAGAEEVNVEVVATLLLAHHLVKIERKM